jgi:translation initiation factor 2B subunit (eIF-2B alpha/beta/delta family)
MSESSLKAGIYQLQNDRTNGAQILATNALNSLKNVIAEADPTNGNEYWAQIRLAGYRLSTSRPSMGSAITSAITQALDSVKKAWTEELGNDWQHQSHSLKFIAQERFEDVLQKRMHTSEQLGQQFEQYLGCNSTHLERPLRILTLSSSSSLRRCLLQVLGRINSLHVELRILESRPRCEGASFATQLLRSLLAEIQTRGLDEDKLNLKVIVAPDSHVCKLAEDVDIVLLGADRISSSGDVSNKMGSLAAALCAKELSPSVKIIVATESDKIATPGAMMEHAVENNEDEEVVSGWDDDTQKQYHSLKSEEHLVVENTYFEWVPARYVDTYVTERGVLNVEQIQAISVEKERLEDEIFDEEIVALASQQK